MTAPAMDPTGQAAVWWRLEDLDPWQENPRIYPIPVVKALAGLVQRYGFNTTINAHWPTRRIIRGHRRRLALLDLWKADPTMELPGSPGPGYVPVRFTGGTWEEAERDALADNRAQEDGAWDLDQVGRLVERWQAEGVELLEIAKATAFTAARANRRAFLVEIDPLWCDVIRHRWTAWAKEAGVDPGPGALELGGWRVKMGQILGCSHGSP